MRHSLALSALIVGYAACFFTPSLATAQLPDEAQKMLGYYVGDWEYEWEEKGNTYHGKWSVQWSDDQTSILSQWSSVGPNGPSNGTKVAGWDNAIKQMVDAEFGAQGQYTLSHYAAESSRIDVGKGVGSSTEGERTRSQLRVEKDQDQFLWTVSDSTEAGKQVDPILYTFRRVGKQSSSKPMPDTIHRTIEDHLIGTWATVQTFGGEASNGSRMNRWSENEVAVLGNSSATGQNGRIMISSIIAWEPELNSVVEHGYTSAGDHWTIRWTTFLDDRWEGTGTGHVDGRAWASETQIEFGTDSIRYEDITNGERYLLEYTRETDAQAVRAFHEFADFMTHGKWVKQGSEKIVDQHTWIESKKFVSINSLGAEARVACLYGIDPITKQFTIWSFHTDGAMGSSVCSDFRDRKGTWKGTMITASGERTEMLARMELVGQDEVRFTISDVDGKESVETWKRE
ncbi:hypothetical protein [Novipirellula artificiosorum]|uniref:Uncharacterized protein n=1 Tax=Novipirellula artificiosorum TaxID=2528016 RepID=A0A5C6CI07_9BACT|nr:hypothetical protein [Novipirellula artificiosorum]TWU24463.1 hypothetical protein Poly41_70930 [Novipirellula artificiosorum]